MRMVLAAAAALAVFAVAGCDINTGTPKETKVGCNCTAAPAATPPAAVTDDTPPRPHHHHRWHGYGRNTGRAHGYAWRRDYSEISVATYDYRSDSHSYVTGGETDSAGGGGGTYTGGSVHGGWVDGYGRGHGGAGDGAHDDRATVDRARLAPWRGYDIDCPDNDPNRRN